jgi:hypothetical protein
MGRNKSVLRKWAHIGVSCLSSAPTAPTMKSSTRCTRTPAISVQFGRLRLEHEQG